MFLHQHPYPPFLFPGVKQLIVGTLPPPRFSLKDLKEGDVDFCYGSRDGQLWPILDQIFDLNLLYQNSPAAIAQRKQFLQQRKIGICDIVQSAQRQKIDASDLGMQQVVLRNLLGVLQQYPTVTRLLFTGGNSKNGPEYFFRKHLKKQAISLTVVNNQPPRIHQFSYLGRSITTVSLIAPSGAANRAVGSMLTYKKMKQENPNFTTVDFRVQQYQKFF